MTAMRSFSSRFIDAPGDCSPSRRVVSKMRTWFGLLGRFIAQTSGTADGARRTAFVAPNAGHGVADALRGCEVAGSRHGVPGIGGAFPDARAGPCPPRRQPRSEEPTSELQSLMRIPSAVFCLKK